MLLFNLPYKLFVDREMLLVDTLINSLTETYMLFLNLVLAHGIYASSDASPVLFYGPKLAICSAIFLGLWAWSYADLKEFEAYIRNDF